MILSDQNCGSALIVFADADPAKMTAYDKYMYENYYSIGTDDDPYANEKRIQKIKDDLTAEIEVICKQYPSFCLFKDKLLSKSNDLLDLLLQVFTKSDAKAMELFSKDPSSLLF